MAYTNDDVNQLNLALRDVRKGRGELGEDHQLDTAHGRFLFSTGDRVLFTGTDKKQGITNGKGGTIEAIDGTHLAVKLDGRHGKTINFDAANFDKFRHGYAGTIYKAQGRTLDQTYLYHSEHWRSAASYVALTRHRDNTALFVARGTAKDVTELARQMSRTDDRRAASMFEHAQHIEAKPLTAPEILARFSADAIPRKDRDMQTQDGKPPPAANTNAHLEQRSGPGTVELEQPGKPEAVQTSRPSEPEPGRYAELKREPMTLEAIRRDPWNAVILDLPDNASSELYLAANRAAHRLDSTPDAQLPPMPFPAPADAIEWATLGDEIKTRIGETVEKGREAERREAARFEALQSPNPDTAPIAPAEPARPTGGLERAASGENFRVESLRAAELEGTVHGVADHMERFGSKFFGWVAGQFESVINYAAEFFAPEPKMTAAQVHDTLQAHVGNLEKDHAQAVDAAQREDLAAYEQQAHELKSQVQDRDLSLSQRFGHNATREVQLGHEHEADHGHELE